MQYDLDMVRDLCDELGLQRTSVSGDPVQIQVAEGAELVLQNLPDDDSLIGFSDTGWHSHGDLMFADARGYYVELTYLDVLTGLADGSVLICELWRPDGLEDRWLTHKDFANDFQYMQAGDEIRVRPASVAKSAKT
jgi:hypothetical protein